MFASFAVAAERHSNAGTGGRKRFGAAIEEPDRLAGWEIDLGGWSAEARFVVRRF
jgi:hypothetical protein